jgi:6-phosphofructokinase 1
MSRNIKHIGIFTSGGDSPGMNAALYGATKAALVNGMRISGIRRGYEGMIEGDFVSLHEKDLQRSVHKGGTILKTARSERFRKEEGRNVALENLKKKGIDALIAIGGDGTFRGMLAFSEQCTLPFIGIPGTIDNDLAGTDYTLGFDTAVNTAIENIDKIRDTAESHDRVFVVEVMGRDSGYIAIHCGLGTGADSILIPESSEDFNWLLEKIRHYHSEEELIVVVSEGDELGADLIASKIREANPSVDLRISILGHVQRGGHPSAFDRILGIRLGVASVKALQEGQKNVMAGIVNNSLTMIPSENVVKQHQVGTELQELLTLFYLK